MWPLVEDGGPSSRIHARTFLAPQVSVVGVVRLDQGFRRKRGRSLGAQGLACRNQPVDDVDGDQAQRGDRGVGSRHSGGNCRGPK